MKNLQYRFYYGIAPSNLHCRRSSEYAKAALFPWNVHYDLGAYRPPPKPNHRVFIAVVRGFAKVIVEIDFGDAITIHMYDEWSTLAKELLETQQMMSIIVV
ncbi:hypothetical protein ANCDUO_00357 [Ancylostoma duodenale]|uniref:Uncharacterized protein n=1 Tax=Ancylostoma duodenale TaxID=51022 RepID=A0A0C2H612_9BILA|nr:hypothetical protein ANCDUO_00357 [Ancylostoma duodenale]